MSRVSIAMALVVASTLVVIGQSLTVTDGPTSYRVDFTDDNGTPAHITVPKRSRFSPIVNVVVSTDQISGLLVYDYDVRNHVRSPQTISQITMTLNGSISVHAPSGWKADDGCRGIAAWNAIGSDGGIMPGQSAGGFLVRSTYLPGIALARLRAAGEAPEIPALIPPLVRQEVAELDKRDLVITPVIAPMLRFDPNEENALGIFVARLQSHFGGLAFGEGHPHAELIWRDLESASKASASGNQSAVLRALDRLALNARVASASKRTRDVGAALHMSAAFVSASAQALRATQ